MNEFPLLKKWLDLTVEAARLGGAILKQFWKSPNEIREKSPGNLVTEADLQSEKIILEFLFRHFPDHQILAEESGQSLHPSDFVWAVDPLDGTTNYAHHYPMAAVSIGLIYKLEPILGVVYNPFTEELFEAAKGLGAKLNERPIGVSTIANLSDALLATGFAYDRRETPDNNYAEFCRFTDLTQGVRRAGAASLDLAYVACGRLDGYWERGLKPWDMAAGAVLVNESGGRVSDYKSGALNFEQGRILASNGHLHSAMSSILQSEKPAEDHLRR